MNVNSSNDTLTKAADLWTLTVHMSFIVEGAAMVVGNALLIIAILSQKRLRKHEFLMIVGLALGDLLYGIGYCSAGVHRFRLGYLGQHLNQVSRWSCMLQFQSPFFVVGSQAAAFMLVMVSVDRFLAVRFFSFYMKLTNTYAKRVCCVVYGYIALTLIAVYLLSYFGTQDLPKVSAICISTQLGPDWFGSYQPTIQMGAGLLSVLIFCVTWIVHKKHAIKVSDKIRRSAAHLEKQRKMTRVVGVTVLVTLCCYVIPNLVILIINTAGAKKTASTLNPFAWAIGALNSIINIFIFGTAIKELRITLRAFLCCRRPVFQVQRTTHGPTHRRNKRFPKSTSAVAAVETKF